MLNQQADYDRVLRRSQSASWDLGAAVEQIRLDFDRPFLPESLARTASLPFLDERESLTLNQIQGHAYAHLFFFVEEFIIEQARRLIDKAAGHDTAEKAALHCLEEQERKHQALFLAFKAAFAGGFPVTCNCIENRMQAARNICDHSLLSVTLLMSMLEWVTQRHYMLSFKREASQVDPGFSAMFHLHWVEEAHHTTVDSLEISRLAGAMDAQQRNASVDEFLSLCDLVETQLLCQARLDVDNLSRALQRHFDQSESERLTVALHRSYSHAFIGLGLCHPVFLKIIDDIAPGRDGDLLRHSLWVR